MYKVIILISSVLLLGGCAGSAYRLPQVNAQEVKAMEQKMAENTAPLKTYKRSDKHYKQTLANITKRLSKNAKPLCLDTGYTSCYFEVNYNPGSTVNAYASEGHKITIYRGLLQYLKNNDEMAAVVAHEMGHHLAKHNEEKMQNAATGAAVAGIFTAVILAAANANNPYYNASQNQETLENMMGAGAHIGALSYSKEQEREADLLATYLLSRAQYDLKSAQNVMVILSKFSGDSKLSQSAFLDSHPAGMERVVAWEKAILEIKENSSKLPYANGSQKETIVKGKKP